MCWSRSRGFLPVVVSLAVVLSACQEEPTAGPAEPIVLAVQGPSTCDFGDIKKDARGYFPGTGRNSVLAGVSDLLDVLESDCDAGDQAAYTAHWFDVAAVVQGVLAAETGESVEDGSNFLVGTLSVLAPDGTTPMFDPCNGEADCLPWEGYPALPDFASVLGDIDGAWTIVSTGTDAVCSGFQIPCAAIDPAVRDTWGVEPSVDWPLALHGRTTLVFGAPLDFEEEDFSPTGEPLLNTDLPAYQWLLIPNPVEFGTELSPPAVLEVGLCSTARTSIDEVLVQKGETVLTEAVIDFCSFPDLTTAQSRTTVLGSFASALGTFLPTPLFAAVADRGPGGSAGSFTDFYAIDLPRIALILIPNQPVTGTVGEPLLATDGNPFVVRAVTSSMLSPLEDALITIEVIGNNGLIPSGNGVSGAEVVCDGFVCTGRTQADEDDAPGELPLGLVFTKPGSYTMCFSGHLPPLDLSTVVCSDKFVINP